MITALANANLPQNDNRSAPAGADQRWQVI